MEQEAKYRLLERVKPKQIEGLDWVNYRLGERESKSLCDTILDTEQRILTAKKHALRIRQDGDRVILTLKIPGKVEGALHSRQEFEHDILPEAVQQRANWPQDIGGPIEALIGGAELVPLLEVRNKRRVWLVYKDEVEVAELALDRGSISAAGRSVDFHELEIELKGQGALTDIHALAEFLQQAFPMEAEPLTKRERGTLLLEHREHVAEIQAVKDQTPMTPTAELAEAGRSMIAQHAAKLHEMLPVARVGDDPEGVHKSRVSIRRMRAMLSALSEAVYDPELVKKLRKQLKALASTLGEVRDPDVFLMELQDYLDTLAPEEVEHMQPLITMMHQRREQGRIQLFKTLDKKKTTKTLEALDAFVTTPGAGVAEFAGADYERPRTLVRHWAGSMLWSHYEIVRAYEVNLSEAPPETLHELRIEIKHLRYLIELFMDALPEEAESLHEQLVTAQDQLGEIQDAEVALELVDGLLLDHADNQALHNYRVSRDRKRQELVGTVGQVLNPIFGLPFRRRLGSIISKL